MGGALRVPLPRAGGLVHEAAAAARTVRRPPHPAEPVSLLRLERASFRYAGAGIPALADISLAIGPGELVALAGRPGSGTSTLLLVSGGYAPRLVGGTLEGTRELSARRPAIVFAT